MSSVSSDIGVSHSEHALDAIVLEVLQPGFRPWRVRCDAGREPVVRIGTRSSAHLRIAEPASHGIHSAILLSETGATLKDLGTIHGTMHNSRRVDEARLADGDMISIGGTHVRVELLRRPLGMPVRVTPPQPAPTSAPSPEAVPTPHPFVAAVAASSIPVPEPTVPSSVPVASWESFEHRPATPWSHVPWETPAKPTMMRERYDTDWIVGEMRGERRRRLFRSLGGLLCLTLALAAVISLAFVEQTVVEAPASAKMVSPDDAPLAKAATVQPEAPTPAVESATGLAYTVRPGDTLSRLARRFFGDPMAYTTLFDANRDVLRAPHELEVGQVIRIPVSDRGSAARP